MTTTTDLTVRPFEIHMSDEDLNRLVGIQHGCLKTRIWPQFR